MKNKKLKTCECNTIPYKRTLLIKWDSAWIGNFCCAGKKKIEMAWLNCEREENQEHFQFSSSIPPCTNGAVLSSVWPVWSCMETGSLDQPAFQKWGWYFVGTSPYAGKTWLLGFWSHELHEEGLTFPVICSCSVGKCTFMTQACSNDVYILGNTHTHTHTDIPNTYTHRYS